MNEPIRASDLPSVDPRTEDQKRREQLSKAAKEIRLRHAIQRQLGVDVPSGSSTNLGNLESRLRRVDRQVGDKGKAKRG